VTLTDIEAGLSQCTHLVYGWTGINDAKKVVSLNSQQDLDQGKGLKASFTTLSLVFTVLNHSRTFPTDDSAEKEVSRT
jgi:hypothetical protein